VKSLYFQQETLNTFFSLKHCCAHFFFENQDDDGEGGQRLHPFEVAQLANLIDSEQAEDPNDPASQLDECRAVIPSLARFSDEFLVKEVCGSMIIL